MKTLLRIIVAATLFAALSTAPVLAQDHATHEVSTEEFLVRKIANAQSELQELKAITLKDLPKSEKKSIKKRKRILRRTISKDRELLTYANYGVPYNGRSYYGRNYRGSRYNNYNNAYNNRVCYTSTASYRRGRGYYNRPVQAKKKVVVKRDKKVIRRAPVSIRLRPVNP